MIGDLEKPYYGYRINKHITVASFGSGIASIALAIIFTILTSPGWVLALCWASGTVLLIYAVFWWLSVGWVTDPKKVGALQDNFTDQLRTIWDGKGAVLDIGTGRGQAAVEIAKRFPEARVIGVDLWTKFWNLWGMTRTGAEVNAAIANVSDRCTFRYGSALDLPFENGEFQLVVSTFVLHEIHVPDRTVVLGEIARVLAPGGTFLICDLFPRGYRVKNVPELLKKVRQLGVEDVGYKSLKDAGVNLGGLSNIWGIAYLSGKKHDPTKRKRSTAHNLSGKRQQ